MSSPSVPPQMNADSRCAKDVRQQAQKQAVPPRRVASHAAYERKLPDCQRCRIAPPSVAMPASSHARPPRIATSTTHPRKYFESTSSGLTMTSAVDLVDVVLIREKVVARRECGSEPSGAIRVGGDRSWSAMYQPSSATATARH